MAVKLTRRTKYSFRVLNLAMLSILCTEAGYAYQPASASACVALESNAERLNCYDGLFSVKLSDVTVASVLVAEGAGSAGAGDAVPWTAGLPTSVRQQDGGGHVRHESGSDLPDV